MTFREKYESELRNFGFSNEQARKVMNRVINSGDIESVIALSPTWVDDGVLEALNDCWNEQAEMVSFPSNLLQVIWFGIRHNALEWINENASSQLSSVKERLEGCHDVPSRVKY